MNTFVAHLLQPALPALLCLLLTACGGGGGGGGAGDAGSGGAGSTNPTPPGGPGPGPGTGSTPGPVTSAAPTGRLWHNNYALDFVTGSQVAHLDQSPSTLADPDRFAIPWRDGTQYILTDYRPARGETTITVKETGTRRVLFELVYDGYARDPKPSPISRDVVLLTVGNSITERADYAFINLRTRSFIDRFAEGSVSVDWLPDGRYLQLGSNGQISVGTPGSSRAAAGSFNLQGRRLGDVKVNHQGTQFIVTLTQDSGAIAQRDLWVANIDGSNPGRLTSTNITSYGHWSPDGRHIAFDDDTGFLCNGAGCLGSCSLWVVASTTRNANPLPSFPGEASAFNVRNAQGSSRRLGCELLAWLR